MIGEHFPKVSPPSRQSLKSYNAKFVMDKCARNKYGALTQSDSVGDLGSVRVLGEYWLKMLTIRTEGHEFRTEITGGRYFLACEQALRAKKKKKKKLREGEKEFLAFSSFFSRGEPVFI